MNNADGWGDDVYQADPDESPEDWGGLDTEDTLDDDSVGDPLDRGWSPPERPWAAGHTGVTAAERAVGETLDQRLAEEVPDSAGLDGDSQGTDGELLDSDVGLRRSGRLVAPGEGVHEDAESALVATGGGIDGAAASAEEAAVHIFGENPRPR
ncbi:DUF5709 domain-containing protein [Streptomyces griseoluteus]|uniref:DUF5709 domain-containing protein n=1 Tax=Streptomyces griseoluteus TaxID=29306 RepID=UPI00381620BB